MTTGHPFSWTIKIQVSRLSRIWGQGPDGPPGRPALGRGDLRRSFEVHHQAYKAGVDSGTRFVVSAAGAGLPLPVECGLGESRSTGLPTLQMVDTEEKIMLTRVEFQDAIAELTLPDVTKATAQIVAPAPKGVNMKK